MRKIYVVMTVFLCVLMMCCKEEKAPQGKMIKPGIYNTDCLDSLFSYKMEGVWDYFPEPGPQNVLLYHWCMPLHDALVEYNKHFSTVIKETIIEANAMKFTEEEAAKWDELCKYGGEKRRNAERNLDTIINHQRFIFITEL